MGLKIVDKFTRKNSKRQSYITITQKRQKEIQKNLKNKTVIKQRLNPKLQEENLISDIKEKLQQGQQFRLRNQPTKN